MTHHLVDQFEQALLSLDQLAVRNILVQATQNGNYMRFIEEAMVPALERLGQDWEKGRVALSQIYVSGRMCEKLVDTLVPSEQARPSQPKTAIAVLEDYHLLGKRIVYSVLRSSGFAVLDYGRVTVDELVQKVNNDGVKVLLISTLMLPSALQVKQVRANLSREVKIVVGGAPFRFDDQLWQEVGADAMGYNASAAIEIMTKLSEVQ